VRFFIPLGGFRFGGTLRGGKAFCALGPDAPTRQHESFTLKITKGEGDLGPPGAASFVRVKSGGPVSPACMASAARP